MTYQKERRQVCHMTQVYISEREAKESEPLRESVLYGRTLRALRHNLFFVFLWFLLLSTFFFYRLFFRPFFPHLEFPLFVGHVSKSERCLDNVDCKHMQHD